MIGDKLIIKEKHYRAARQIVELVMPFIETSEMIYAMSVAGESGSGKSETAVAIKEELAKRSINTTILQQDDYFVLPPKTNDQHRRGNIKWVGKDEVNLELIDQHLTVLKQGGSELIKPLVVYADDTITTESLNVKDCFVVIAEGTYTTALVNIDCHVFIDLTYHQTKKSRLERAREEQDQFLEKVLEIEHKIISAHKEQADFIINEEFNVYKP